MLRLSMKTNVRCAEHTNTHARTHTHTLSTKVDLCSSGRSIFSRANPQESDDLGCSTYPGFEGQTAR